GRACETHGKPLSLYGPERAELQEIHDNHLLYHDYIIFYHDIHIKSKPPMNGIFTPNIGGFAKFKAQSLNLKT
ncbi:MAG: hypothetical protein IKX30_17250, partial [Victivallales bacterium]|nr:hypothetical protein [Victivallales bacterium]